MLRLITRLCAIGVIATTLVMIKADIDPAFNTYGHILIDVNERSLYETICIGRMKSIILQYRISCFAAKIIPENEWAYGSKDVCRIWFIPQPSLYYTHVLDYEDFVNTQGDITTLQRELTMNMALDLFFDPEADQELRNTKKFKFEDEDEEEETYRKISGLSRFFYPKKPNFLTPNEFKSDEEFVKNCYFSINQICNGSTLFPKFIKHYYKDATKFMRMLEVHKVYEGEGEEVEIEEPELHEYKVHLYSNYPKDYLLADIMHYIKLKLKMYTHEAKKTIEMALWKRECILINEINEMLYDITNFTGQMQTKMRILVVTIMNGYYNLASHIHRHLKNIINHILPDTVDVVWDRVELWYKYLELFLDDIRIKLQNIMNKKHYNKLREAAKAYHDSVLFMQRVDKKGEENKFEKSGNALVALLENEITCHSLCRFGIMGTRAWFLQRENTYQMITL